MEFPALLLVIVLMVLSNWQKLAWSTKQTYIVHVKNNYHQLTMSHAELCTSSLASVSTSDQMLYLYTHAIPGYSATLTKQEARSLRAHQNILSVHPQTTYHLHTTRTPHFLGLDQHHDQHQHQQQLPEAAAQQLVIIGVLDSGVWPESQSFDDTGYGPVSETRWNGTCEANIRCNNKLIGARSFSKAYEADPDPTTTDLDLSSALDFDGHGTHVMSTAGGSSVPNASLFGLYANGTARGMAPYARLASYKVCWGQVCRGADILAGMDRAIEDGVDVMSMSIGSGLIGHDAPYYNDPIAMGAFAAVRKGIFVSCSAGNSGPIPSVIANAAPWIATVGAGTLDREFPAYVVLGNGKHYHGVSLYNYLSQQQEKQQHPIVYASLCLEGTLDPEKVLGKIVVCDRGGNISRAQKGAVVKRAGGRGMVLASTAQNREYMVADAHFLPATSVTESAGDEIKKYISSSSASSEEATAAITFEGTRVGPGGIWPTSPVVATFSSRGPNPETPHVLKPDMIAPGLNILAAWPDTVGPSGSKTDDRRVEFNIVSGTSMSCPHVSGLAALLKAAHPDWSPAAIRSALMTTAYSTYKDRDDDFIENNGTIILDEATGEAATPFGYGAGHVDPIAALDPGLVYDLSAEDYLNFLCAINYTSQQVQLIARNNTTRCDKKYIANDLNYPSFAVPVDLADRTKCGAVYYANHTRTLTKVGEHAGSTTYRVKLYSPSHSIKIYATPSTLTFDTPNEKKSYTVTFEVPTNMPANASQFGRIEWSDGKHTVGSPIAFSWT